MSSHFSAPFFIANRRNLRQSLQSDGVVIVAANGLLQRTADSSFSFQQDSNFWYLTGLVEPDLILVISPEAEYLISPDRDAVRTAFDGAVNSTELASRSGISEVYTDTVGWERLRDLIGHQASIFITGDIGMYDRRHGMWSNPAAPRLHQKLKRHYRGIQLVSIDRQLAALRIQKQPEELAALQQAIDITAATFTDIRDQEKLKTWQHEHELEAAISFGFRHRGAAGHGFTPIVAGGKRATTLHNVNNNARLAPDEIIVIDIGAEVEHYSADVTRTISLRPPSERQREIHDAVMETQNYALSLLRPGTELRSYEQAVAKYIGRQLRKLKLAKTIDSSSIHRYFPHATSHFLGLDVHDAGDYSQPLQPGMVLTCEPGIYSSEEGIGVRIEDDVLITKTGNTVLSRACPKDLW